MAEIVQGELQEHMSIILTEDVCSLRNISQR